MKIKSNPKLTHLIGLTEEECRNQTELKIRVVQRDGVDLPHIMDIRNDRVNICLKNGICIRYYIR